MKRKPVLNKQVVWVMGFLLGCILGMVIGKEIYTDHPARAIGLLFAGIMGSLILGCLHQEYEAWIYRRLSQPEGSEG